MSDPHSPRPETEEPAWVAEEWGGDATVRRPDGSRIIVGDALYHPANMRDAAVIADALRNAALPAAEPAATADAAWEALRDDIAGVAYELTRRPNGPSELRGELSGIIDRHCSIIEAALTAAGDAEREVERELAYSHGYGDAIRSAGTPPASRKEAARLLKPLRDWPKHAVGYQPVGWRAGREAGFRDARAIVRDALPAIQAEARAAATPPEPVGGREALREAVARELFDDIPNDKHGQLCPIWTRRSERLRKHEAAPAWTDCDCWQLRLVRRLADIALGAPLLRAALQASPPTGVSETVDQTALDLPERVVVGANGAYWRDYGTHYSMAVVSEDNDPVEPVAIYVRDYMDPVLDRTAPEFDDTEPPR